MVKLIPMDPSDFDAYRVRSTTGYAEDLVKGEDCLPEKALEKAREEFDHLLPDGLQTMNEFIFSILDETTGKKIGILWVEVKMNETPRRAFGYDFELFEEYRGKGFGKQTLLALDEKLKSMDVETMRLHVFAHNTTAFELYKKMGFEMTNINMRKYYKKK